MLDVESELGLEGAIESKLGEEESEIDEGSVVESLAVADGVEESDGDGDKAETDCIDDADDDDAVDDVTIDADAVDDDVDDNALCSSIWVVGCLKRIVEACDEPQLQRKKNL